MKKFIPILIMMFYLGFQGHAQLVILDENLEDVTNQTITINGTPDDTYFKVQLYFSNTGDEDVDVFVTKHEIDIVEGANNTFCWKDYCFSPFVFDVDDPITLGSGEISLADDFYTEFHTGGVAGISEVMYEFYSEDESFENVTITVVFNIETPTSTGNILASSTWKLKDARPNPARDHTWINYDLPFGVQNAQIVVRNLLGNLVHTESLSLGNERVRINTAGMSNGIYIYSLIIDNQVVQSKRLVVAN
ncbi:MAG: T9SS C-terminal target domain-containing protein [Bacteroidetes bacterium]|nr:MAG: T9SS C-terminal target domain-containing protein [Bacteroidota bacterium]